jgi:CheY-like chemotaxis protein
VKPGPYVVLTVSDTGTGMTPEVMSRIFEPFFTTKSMGVGTGLGLATVYGIVEQAGGFVRVTSEPGSGATFRVYLPLTLAALELPREAPAGMRAARGSETVLVVEDQDDVRRLAVSILKRNGYRVIEASNGPGALALAAEFADPIDLLITDVIMPGMTGRELASQVAVSRTHLKVLYMSGYDADVISRQGVLEPGMAYLPKPFAPVELTAKVREVLGEGELRRRVLVIDDDAAVRAVVSETLGGAGFDVLPAADGEAGLQLVESHQVDLVITDLVVPEHEGLKTVKMLRERFPEVRVIAMSGAFEGEYLKAAARMGAQATFLKPVDTGRLLAAVREMLP